LVGLGSLNFAALSGLLSPEDMTVSEKKCDNKTNISFNGRNYLVRLTR
jgi:hypothetical protein